MAAARGSARRAYLLFPILVCFVCFEVSSFAVRRMNMCRFTVNYYYYYYHYEQWLMRACVRVYCPKIAPVSCLLCFHARTQLIVSTTSLPQSSKLLDRRKKRTNQRNKLNTITDEHPDRILKVNETESQKCLSVCVEFRLLPLGAWRFRLLVHKHTFSRLHICTRRQHEFAQ